MQIDVMGSDSSLSFYSVSVSHSFVAVVFLILPSALNWNDINFQLCYQVIVTCLAYRFWILHLLSHVYIIQSQRRSDEKKNGRGMLAGQMAMIGLKDCHHIIACTMHDVHLCINAQQERERGGEHILSSTVSHINTYIHLVHVCIHRHRIESSTKSQMERNTTTFTSRNFAASQVHKCIFCQVIHFEFAMPFKIETFIPARACNEKEIASEGRSEWIHLNSNHVTWILSLKQNQINLMV